MKKVMLVAAFAPFVLASAGIANAASVPCEDMLKQLRDAEKTATMNDADKSASPIWKRRASSAARPMTTSGPTSSSPMRSRSSARSSAHVSH